MDATPAAKPVSARILSVDALRGFDMFWIVGGRDVVLALVAVGAVVLPAAWIEWLTQHVDWSNLRYQMDHVLWSKDAPLYGFSAWDMVMPLFLFVVGVAMPMAFAKRLGEGQGKLSLYVRIVRRVLLLWVLGMIAQGSLLDFHRWVPQLVQDAAEPGSVQQFHLHPFSNTLQAIAVGYLVASIALIHLPKIAQAAVAVLLLVGYWALLAFVTVPGADGSALQPDQNLARYVDELVLGRFCDGTTYTWVLSGMGFAATVLLGVFAGHVLRTGEIGIVKTFWLIVLGVVCLVLGLLWHGEFTVLGHDVDLLGPPWQCPMVKHLWTSSMVLYAAGWSYLLLALFYLVIDVLGLRWTACCCTVIGANAIFAYMAVRLIPFNEIANRLVGGLAKHLGSLGQPWPEVGKLIVPLTAFSVLWLLLRYMYRKGTYLRV